MKLSVVVPFYNELRTLPTVIDRPSRSISAPLAWRRS